MTPGRQVGMGQAQPMTFYLIILVQQVLNCMQIRCKNGQLGPSKGQSNSPHDGFPLGTDKDIIVADTNNHLIQKFEKTGTFKLQFEIPVKEGQLWYSSKVTVMRFSGKCVICDRGNERSRMQMFTKN